MTAVGWVGLGKLGLPCALALEQYGHVEIVGYDVNERLPDVLAGNLPPANREADLEDLIDGTRLTLVDSVNRVVAGTDGIIFLAVQTPHAPEYGGEQPMPALVRDFDYSWLQRAVSDVSAACDELGKDVTLAVISTVLPGTLRTKILPTLSDRVKLVYNPFFIAMGTTVRDFLNPEFILLGCENFDDAMPLIDLYDFLHHGYHQVAAPVRLVSLESAELTKVAYNTFISMKIVFANTLMEISDLIGADVDDVADNLAAATDRVISPAYMRGGMGDGGACHPRDNIAMSWLAKSLGLTADPFEFVTRAREAQSEGLAQRIFHEAENRGLPVILLGKSYKPESDLTYGSPALLLANQLTTLGVEFRHWDPYLDKTDASLMARPAVYVICTKHAGFQNHAEFPSGSALIDPFRYINPQPGVEIVGLGRGWRT